VENKKLLSTAGKLKLLSGADKAGLNLAKVAAKHVQRSSASYACLLAQTMRCLLCIDHTDGDAQCCLCIPNRGCVARRWQMARVERCVYGHKPL
jgi:hypothetical protein